MYVCRDIHRQRQESIGLKGEPIYACAKILFVFVGYVWERASSVFVCSLGSEFILQFIQPFQQALPLQLLESKQQTLPSLQFPPLPPSFQHPVAAGHSFTGWFNLKHKKLQRRRVYHTFLKNDRAKEKITKRMPNKMDRSNQQITFSDGSMRRPLPVIRLPNIRLNYMKFPSEHHHGPNLGMKKRFWQQYHVVKWMAWCLLAFSYQNWL